MRADRGRKDGTGAWRSSGRAHCRRASVNSTQGGSTMKRIVSYEVWDHGVDHAQYFTGASAYGRINTITFTGAGDTPAAALDDAIEMAAMDDLAVDSIAEELSHESDLPDHAEDCDDPAECDGYCQEGSELYHYVTLTIEYSPGARLYHLWRCEDCGRLAPSVSIPTIDGRPRTMCQPCNRARIAPGMIVGMRPQAPGMAPDRGRVETVERYAPAVADRDNDRFVVALFDRAPADLLFVVYERRDLIPLWGFMAQGT
jgi:hypothetical protein